MWATATTTPPGPRRCSPSDSDSPTPGSRWVGSRCPGRRPAMPSGSGCPTPAARTGIAVPQAYLTFPAAAGEPPAQLEAFVPVNLAARAVPGGDAVRSVLCPPGLPGERLDHRAGHLHLLGRDVVGRPPARRHRRAALRRSRAERGPGPQAITGSGPAGLHRGRPGPFGYHAGVDSGAQRPLPRWSARSVTGQHGDRPAVTPNPASRQDRPQ